MPSFRPANEVSCERSITGLRQPGPPARHSSNVSPKMKPVRPSARATAMPRSVPPTPNFSAELPGPVRSATLTVGGWTCAVLMPRSVTTSLFGNTALVSLTDAALAAELARDAGELLLQVRREEGF